MRIKIVVQAREPTIAKARNPRTIARTNTGIRFHNLTIVEAEGGDWGFVSLTEDSNYRASWPAVNSTEVSACAQVQCMSAS